MNLTDLSYVFVVPKTSVTYVYASFCVFSGLVFVVMGGTPVWRFQPENASEWVDCSDRFIKYNISLEIPARECPLWG